MIVEDLSGAVSFRQIGGQVRPTADGGSREHRREYDVRNGHAAPESRLVCGFHFAVEADSI